jgi:hypothetical protein
MGFLILILGQKALKNVRYCFEKEDRERERKKERERERERGREG